MRAILLYLVMFIVAAASVSAGDAVYNFNGADFKNRNTYQAAADADTYPLLAYTITFSGASLAPRDTHWAAGDMDGNGIPEIVYNDQGLIRVIEFVGQTVQIKQELGAQFGVPPIMYDSDGDGRTELYSCFIAGGAGGKYRKYEYDDAAGAIVQRWNKGVSDGTGTGTGPALNLCDMQTATRYAGACYDNPTGDRCLFVYDANRGAGTAEPYYTTFNTSNGAISINTAIGGGACMGAAGHFGGFIAGGEYSTDKIVLCDVEEGETGGEGGSPEAYFNGVCGVAGNTWYTFAANLSRDSGQAVGYTGFLSQSIAGLDTGEVLTNPSCYDAPQLDGADAMYFYGDNDAITGEIYRVMRTSISINDNEFGGEYDRYSDPVVPLEANNPTMAFDDVCFFASKSGEMAWDCGDFIGPIVTDESDGEIVISDADFVFAPMFAATTSGGNLGGDALSDMVSSNGIYIAEEFFQLIPFDAYDVEYRPALSTYSPINDSSCAPFDVNADSFADYVCHSNTGMSIFLTDQPNDMIDLVSYTKDIKTGTPICPGGNLSVLVSYERGHYTDVESDDVQVLIDWNRTIDPGFENVSAFEGYGSSFTLTNQYNDEAVHTIEVCMTDVPHQSDTSSECISETITVASVVNCTSGVKIFNEDTGGASDDTPPPPGPDGATVTTDAVAVLEDLQERITGQGQTNADIFWLIIIMGATIGAAYSYGAGIGIAVFLVWLSVATVAGLVSGFYLLVILLGGAFAIWILSAIRSRGSGGGG
ncbi:MAG TPA: hypothetical protein VII92_14765 [Anaerolineae bacterium]